MEYLLLIYSEESKNPDPSSKAFAEIYGGYMEFNKLVTEADVLRGLNPLESVTTAKTVRLRDDKTETTDGPFAETKEQLAGYYLLDCENLDEAISYAAKIPSARWGSIEIRPIKKFDRD